TLSLKNISIRLQLLSLQATRFGIRVNILDS
ncbi:MAG: hypothetical protein ACJAZF_005187, partial [Granulosicoccus sp.]